MSRTWVARIRRVYHTRLVGWPFSLVILPRLRELGVHVQLARIQAHDLVVVDLASGVACLLAVLAVRGGDGPRLGNDLLVHVRVVGADADEVVVVHEALRFNVVSLSLSVPLSRASYRLAHLERPSGHAGVLGVLILLLDNPASGGGLADDVRPLVLASSVPGLILGEQ